MSSSTVTTNTGIVQNLERTTNKRCKLDSNRYSTSYIASFASPSLHDAINPKIIKIPASSFPIPIEAFRILIQSNFLAIKDIGKLLLFVSKTLSSNLFDNQNEIWEILSIHHFGHEICGLARNECPLLATRINASNPEQLFRSLLKGEIRPPKSNIRPLKYTPHDYYIIVNVYTKKGSKACFSTMIHGPQAPEFFIDGSININAIFLPFENEGEVERDWSVQIHLLRTTDQKYCCIFESDQTFSDYNDYCESFWFYSKNERLEMSDIAYEQQLLEELSATGISIDENLTYGINFHVYLNCIARDCCCCEPGVITSMNIRANIHHDLDNFPKVPSVGMAQLLELLYAWDV
mmetsp:Transcript_28378/g.35100  ORF Transcript_28378/g.35100 Transcript_28378/m.35100 type:complete len:349 (+) Transcript_28378:139-1185(+)